MALLKFFVVMLVLVSGCYAPEIGDCSVSCTTDQECAGDQVCTAQGLCAGGASACEGNSGTVDAGTTPRMIDLRVTVDGDGKVSVGGAGECVPGSSGPMGNSCMMKVLPGPITLVAVPNGKPFERWTSTICAGQDASCNVTLTVNANVGAKFK